MLQHLGEVVVNCRSLVTLVDSFCHISLQTGVGSEKQAGQEGPGKAGGGDS